MAQMPEAIILRKTEETKTGVTYCIADVKTNADRIRSMTDDGIEDWYWWMHKEMMRYTDSRLFVHDWLKAPVEEIEE